MKNIILFLGLLLVLIFAGKFFLGAVTEEKNNSTSLASPSPTNYEYYWSETCPHCANVAEFLDKWEKKDEIRIKKYEIGESFDNKKKFIERGTSCKIPKNQLGVPLLITSEGKCISGDEPIIEYLRNLDNGK